MKTNLLKITTPIENSLVIKTDMELADQWNYNSEIELLYCIKGKRSDYIGNRIQVVEEGELLLCGEDLPHNRLDGSNFPHKYSEEKPEAIVIKFKRDFLGNNFFMVNEFLHVNRLLNRASKGLRFYGNISESVGNRIIRIREMKGVNAILELLFILDILAHSDEYSYICSADYVGEVHKKASKKISKVYQYTIEHFQEEISLDTIAELTNHTKSAFCRFFKLHTHKTYFQYLNEIRIAKACSLLCKEDHDIKDACYGSGFNNLSNFHKQFKRVMGKTPSEYRFAVSLTLSKAQSA